MPSVESRHGIPRVNVLGVGVSGVSMGQAVDGIYGWIDSHAPGYVCVTGVHGVMESQRDESLRRIHNRASMVTPDGMPLVWLSKFHGLGRVERVYGPDLMLEVMQAGLPRSTRHFFYGGGEGVAERLASRLRKRFPGLVLAGFYTPPFRELTPDEDRRVVESVVDARPNVVWVGLSTPKQERWMAEHVGSVGSAVLVGVGAAFDFHAGIKKQAPKWMQRSGLEWSFRLLTEPRRLWRRYLRNNPVFVALVALQLLGLREFELDE